MRKDLFVSVVTRKATTGALLDFIGIKLLVLQPNVTVSPLDPKWKIWIAIYIWIVHKFFYSGH
jgi:hypothetical protein